VSSFAFPVLAALLRTNWGGIDGPYGRHDAWHRAFDMPKRPGGPQHRGRSCPSTTRINRDHEFARDVGMRAENPTQYRNGTFPTKSSKPLSGIVVREVDSVPTGFTCVYKVDTAKP
jgi:hypothetical protein